MAKSVSLEYRISIDEETSNNEKISQVDLQNPHSGKKIDKVVYSPRNEYFATASFMDRSVCVRKFAQGEKGELELKLDRFFDLKETVLDSPICVSDSNSILIGSHYRGSKILETRDYKNNKRKLLDHKDYNGDIVNCGFLTNGDFVAVERDPAYQFHIFSIIRNRWRCTSSTKLNKFKHAVISQDRIFIILDAPFVTMQWNLLTQKFEAQYELDWRLVEHRKRELLFIYFGQEKTSYAITPPTSSSSLELHYLPNSSSESKNSGESHLSAKINFILQYHNDQSFKDQSNNELGKYKDEKHSFEEMWKEDTRDENKVDLQREDIKKHLDDILLKCESKQIEKSLAKQSSTLDSLDGKRYTWTVQNASHDNMLVAIITARKTAMDAVIGK
ncbi:15162_t:CDS:2, partial [Acaulospora morrowiae]